MMLQPRVMVIYKPDEEDDDEFVIDAVQPLGFQYACSGEMDHQEDFHWIGFEWIGEGVPGPAIVDRIKRVIPAAFADACVLFSPHPEAGLQMCALRFHDGKFEEIKH